MCDGCIAQTEHDLLPTNYLSRYLNILSEGNTIQYGLPNQPLIFNLKYVHGYP